MWRRCEKRLESFIYLSKVYNSHRLSLRRLLRLTLLLLTPLTLLLALSLQYRCKSWVWLRHGSESLFREGTNTYNLIAIILILARSHLSFNFFRNWTTCRVFVTCCSCLDRVEHHSLRRFLSYRVLASWRLQRRVNRQHSGGCTEARLFLLLIVKVWVQMRLDCKWWSHAEWRIERGWCFRPEIVLAYLADGSIFSKGKRFVTFGVLLHMKWESASFYFQRINF